ncbi:hypothetical protein C5167_042584 [Papaver somniferum]|uniref:Uncharacterized protein n=1 Tax=Papaver somniferum TaxID=3469 RepID=A0A4Y7L6K6_PAPSO|nr:hypothetical protein C5167_042584 [Papaver somniferum]
MLWMKRWTIQGRISLKEGRMMHNDLAHVNSRCKSAEGGTDYFASAAGHEAGFEIEGRLTRFCKCSGTPSTESLALVRQEDGATPSTASPVVAVDNENEIVHVSNSDG